MRYHNIVKGRFLSRPNRFIAYVEIEGNPCIAHVKNTGRCKELLTEGVTVYLTKAENPDRKTPYDLIAVEKPREGKPPILINMDSQVVNPVAEEFFRAGNLFPDATLIRREVTYGASRFDFYIETPKAPIFLEVKGVTLEQDGVVSFPDAPTERGIKHVKELMTAKENGYDAYVLFVVQMEEATLFRPNRERHAAFADALSAAHAAGVHILAYTCRVTGDSIALNAPLPVCLD